MLRKDKKQKGIKMKKIRTKIVVALMIALCVSSCSQLNSGDRFVVISDNNQFQYEVIVSKMNYVRLVNVTGTIPETLVIPPIVKNGRTSFTVTQIGPKAFQNCSELTSVRLPETLSVIEEAAFEGCSSLREINTPQPLSFIGDYAFSGCVALKKFDLEASISSLGKGCFRGCVSLEEVKFPSSFSVIPSEAFMGCTSLRELNLPATIMQIGADAFRNCVGIRDVYMDRSVQRIGERAFLDCKDVESMTCMTSFPPICSESTFEGVATDIPVTVPMANVQDYQTAVGWSRFSHFVGKY